jgi:hypothetical protein
MKLLKTLTAASLALALVSSANAASYTVHISGSSAFRKAVHAAIVHVLTGPVANWKDTTKNLGNCSQAVFQGTIGSDTYTIETSWSGSASGVSAVATGTNITNWMTSANSMSSVSATTTQGAVSFTVSASSGFTAAGLNSPTTESAVSDLAMSDAFQSTTKYTSPLLTDKIVGVVPFYWVAGKGANAGITNVTPLQVQALLTGGLPTSQFTGSSADESGFTVAIGRDEDSGTRICAFAEGGYGVNTLAVQYQPTISSGVITNLVPWPANTVNGTLYPLGDSGESSGGTLATDLSATVGAGNSAGATDVVGYLGESDAASAVAAGGRYLTYNGQSFGAGAGLAGSDANYYRAIQEGKYTFWSYEHLLYKQSLSGGPLTFAGKLYTQIHDTDAIGTGVKVSTMAVGRSAEGAVVTFGNPYLN